jgi:hypothetical protein
MTRGERLGRLLIARRDFLAEIDRAPLHIRISQRSLTARLSLATTSAGVPFGGNPMITRQPARLCSFERGGVLARLSRWWGLRISRP